MTKIRIRADAGTVNQTKLLVLRLKINESLPSIHIYIYIYIELPSFTLYETM